MQETQSSLDAEAKARAAKFAKRFSDFLHITNVMSKLYLEGERCEAQKDFAQVWDATYAR